MLNELNKMTSRKILTKQQVGISGPGLHNIYIRATKLAYIGFSSISGLSQQRFPVVTLRQWCLCVCACMHASVCVCVCDLWPPSVVSGIDPNTLCDPDEDATPLIRRILALIFPAMLVPMSFFWESPWKQNRRRSGKAFSPGDFSRYRPRSWSGRETDVWVEEERRHSLVSIQAQHSADSLLLRSFPHRQEQVLKGRSFHALSAHLGCLNT